MKLVFETTAVQPVSERKAWLKLSLETMSTIAVFDDPSELKSLLHDAELNDFVSSFHM